MNNVHLWGAVLLVALLFQAWMRSIARQERRAAEAERQATQTAIAHLLRDSRAAQRTTLTDQSQKGGGV